MKNLLLIWVVSSGWLNCGSSPTSSLHRPPLSQLVTITLSPRPPRSVHGEAWSGTRLHGGLLCTALTTARHLFRIHPSEPEQPSALALLSFLSPSPGLLVGQLPAAAPVLVQVPRSAPAPALPQLLLPWVSVLVYHPHLREPHFSCWCCNKFMVWR